MATREENIQKINAELEALSDEELEKVAGGCLTFTFDTSSDSKFLYSYGLMDKHYNGVTVAFNWESISSEVDAGWSKAGITCVTKPWAANQYFVGGKEISHDEAMDIVKSKFPKIRS